MGILLYDEKMFRSYFQAWFQAGSDQEPRMDPADKEKLFKSWSEAVMKYNPDYATGETPFKRYKIVYDYSSDDYTKVRVIEMPVDCAECGSIIKTEYNSWFDRFIVGCENEDCETGYIARHHERAEAVKRWNEEQAVIKTMKSSI